jgi:hypothetical protein
MDQLAHRWTRQQRTVFWSVGALTWLWAAVITFYVDRAVGADETGLFNAVYTFLTDGAIAYPLHGQPHFMTVHPPTHYLLLGALMKSGLTLFEAAGVPIVALLAVIIGAAGYGRFSLPFALGIVLGAFSANVIWADYYTVRPDLHLTLAWLAGLVMLEGGRNREWSPPWLCAGSALCVYAATLHYWGAASVATPLVYGGALLLARRHRLVRIAPRAVAIAIGGCAVGLPYLLLFVIPCWDQILTMLRSVQGDGGISSAIQRHFDAYTELALRTWYGSASRLLVSALVYPVLAFHVPAALCAAVVLVAMRYPVLAIAGLMLPLFVLLVSQGKPMFYYTPEMTLYLIAVYALCLSALQAWATRGPWLSRAAAYAAGALVVIGSLAAVPTTAGPTVQWEQGVQDLDVSRAAAFDVVGEDALVGMISLATWYSAGARYVWYAANELTEVNRAGGNLDEYLAAMDAFVIDMDYWHALPDLAPLGTWYMDRRLSLTGFVLPTTRLDRNQVNLFVSTRVPVKVRGYFLDSDGIRVFEQSDTGAAAFSVWQCRTVLGHRVPPAFYQFHFAYDAAPSITSRTMLLVGSSWDSMSAVEESTRSIGCQRRDVVRGELKPVDRRTLIAALRQKDGRIAVSTTFSEAVAASLAREGGGTEGRAANVTINWSKAGVYTPEGTVKDRRLPVLIKPPAVAWGYGAVMPLELRHDAAKTLLIQVKARVVRGSAGFGLVNDRADAFVARVFRDASATPVTISLVVPANTRFGPLIIQNGGQGDDSLVELVSVVAVELDR